MLINKNQPYINKSTIQPKTQKKLVFNGPDEYNNKKSKTESSVAKHPAVAGALGAILSLGTFEAASQGLFKLVNAVKSNTSKKGSDTCNASGTKNNLLKLVKPIIAALGAITFIIKAIK